MPPKFKRRLSRLGKILKPVLVLLFSFCFLFFAISLTLSLRKFANKNVFSPRIVFDLLTGNPGFLKNTLGRTNILLLGVPGGKHEGADLTDSIIFLSFDFKKREVILISVPRDVWLESLKDKINTAYHYGEEKSPGAGFILSRAAVEEVLGQPLNYTVLLDFSGFEKLINLVGGLKINVERAFDDYKYPIAGREDDPCNGDPEFKCRFEHVHFDSGWQDMNGETALKFVRSRNAEGEEGGDFARSKRQQKVILALKDKILDPKIFLDFGKDKDLVKLLDEATDTDLSLTEIIFLAKFSLGIKDSQIKRLSIEEKLINPPLWDYDGKWVLIPRTGDLSEIQEFVKAEIR